MAQWAKVLVTKSNKLTSVLGPYSRRKESIRVHKCLLGARGIIHHVSVHMYTCAHVCMHTHTDTEDRQTHTQLKKKIKQPNKGWSLWCKSLTPPIRRRRQVALCF